MTTVTGTTGTSPTGADTAAGTKLSADYNMFLKLLTTQMQNQDPLNPTDTAQYTQQLVQFSQVEQSIEQTTTLKSILSSLGTQNLTQASALLGKNVETNSATAGLSATAPAQWSWTADRSVKTLTATITNSAGKVVDTRTVEAGAVSGGLSWDGKTTDGKTMEAGEYTITLKGTDASGNTVPAKAHAIGKVDDVQLANGVITVSVNGVKVPTSSLVRVGA
ncbi:flagellar hook assembly protein FlgD [Sphingomonas sp. CJ20]